jgi:hypothetical protein
MPGMQPDQQPADDELVAAALAAVRRYIDQDRGDDSVAPSRPAWSSAAALAAQGQPPTPGAPPARWGTVERATRAARWAYGIVGM